MQPALKRFSHALRGIGISQADMYHILPAQCHGQYGAGHRQNQPPLVAALFVVADAPGLIELAVAIGPRV